MYYNKEHLGDRTSRMEKAVQLLLKAIETDPNSGAAWYLIGRQDMFFIVSSSSFSPFQNIMSLAFYIFLTGRTLYHFSTNYVPQAQILTADYQGLSYCIHITGKCFCIVGVMPCKEKFMMLSLLTVMPLTSQRQTPIHGAPQGKFCLTPDFLMLKQLLFLRNVIKTIEHKS